MTKQTFKTGKKMGHPSPTVSLVRQRQQVLLGKCKNSKSDRNGTVRERLREIVKRCQDSGETSDFNTLFEDYRTLVGYKQELEAKFVAAFTAETGHSFSPDNIQLLFYLLHSHYPKENETLIPPPTFDSLWTVYAEEPVWDFSTPFRFPCSTKEVEEYRDICLQKAFLEQQLSLTYFLETERTLSFANLDRTLSPSVFRSKIGVVRKGAKFGAFQKITDKRLQNRGFCAPYGDAMRGKCLTKLTSREFAIALKFHELLSEGRPIDIQVAEQAMIFADFHSLIPSFPGIYALTRWIGILSSMDFAMSCPGWVESAARSIGKRKNDCTNAFRRCSDVQVLQLCQVCKIKLYPFHLDVLSKASVK